MNLDFKILRVHCKHGNWLSSEFETEANSVVWTEGSYEIKAKKEGKTIMFVFFFFLIAEEWILNNYWYSVWKHHGDLNVHSTFLINRVILLYLAPFNKSSLKSVPIFDTPTRFNEISGRRQMSLDAKSNCFIVCFKMMYRLTVICSNTSLYSYSWFTQMDKCQISKHTYLVQGAPWSKRRSPQVEAFPLHSG